MNSLTHLPSNHRHLQTPSACSNLSLPISASPFCNAANAKIVNSIASASCFLDSIVVVVVDDFEGNSPVLDDEVVRGAVATGEGDRGFDFDGNNLLPCLTC